MINPEGLSYTILNFDIHLKFACLREAASAKAGILKFELYKIYFNPARIGVSAFLIYEITPLGKKRTTATNKNP